MDMDLHSTRAQSIASDSSSLNHDSKTHARAQHNALERRRRDNIKDMYTSLREEIPNFNHERASRAQILCKTIEQMKDLKDEMERLEKETKELEEEEMMLQKELDELEAAEASCRSTPERVIN